MKEKLIDLLQFAPADEDGNRNVGTLAEHLLKSGVIVLPCKIGDTVYIIDEGDDEYGEPYVLDVEVLSLTIENLGIGIELSLPLGFRQVSWCVIGENVFLTREEAEKALAERSAE